jgi:tetratricopeptide (TPR) repeat protein
VGKVFWTGAVAYMGSIDEDQVKASLHELARKELVRSARRSSVRDQLEYSFWHLLVRDVAYAQIPRAARASKHGAAAAWIEEMAGERVADHAELLAYHYGEALDLATAAGQTADVEALRDAARRFLILAGDHTAGLDQGKAETYYRRALALAPPGTAGRGRLLAKLAEAGWYSSRLEPDEADVLFAEAIEELRAAGEVTAAGEAMVRRYHPLWAKGETARARAVIEEAIAFLEPQGPTPELAAAYTSLTGRLMIGGEEVAALEMAEKSLSLAGEVGAENEVARTLQYRGMARLVQGDARGYDDLRESLRRCLELGLAYPAASGYNNLADWISEEEGFARSYELYQTAIQYGLGHGMPGAARWSRMEATFRLYELGRWDELLEEEDQLIEEDRGEGSGGQITVHALAFKALTLAARGRSDEAAELMADALPRARAIADVQPMWAALRTAAMIEHLRGNHAEAARLAHELQDVFVGPYYSPLLPDVTRILVAAGEVESAADLVARAETPYALWKVAKAAGEAVVLEARGSFDPALALYLDVVERWAAFGGSVEQAYALGGAGRCLLALGRANEARERLTAARDFWSSLGARPMIEEMDVHLAEATALTS